MRAWRRIAWNLFGMADLINAVVLGVLTSGGARYRLSDCADPDLCSAARIPSSFLFADWPVAASVAVSEKRSGVSRKSSETGSGDRTGRKGDGESGY
jgi:hypothetical protein